MARIATARTKIAARFTSGIDRPPVLEADDEEEDAVDDDVVDEPEALVFEVDVVAEDDADVDDEVAVWEVVEEDEPPCVVPAGSEKLPETVPR